jgi:hypothetical protein
MGKLPDLWDRSGKKKKKEREEGEGRGRVWTTGCELHGVVAFMSVRGGCAAVQIQHRTANDEEANARGALPRRYNGGLVTA